MSVENYFPLSNDLNTAQKKVISDNLITRDVKKGTIIHNGNLDCTGLLLVKSGQLRTCLLYTSCAHFHAESSGSKTQIDFRGCQIKAAFIFIIFS